MFLLTMGEYVTGSVSYIFWAAIVLIQDWLQVCVTHSHTSSIWYLHLGFHSYTHISAAIGDRRKGVWQCYTFKHIFKLHLHKSLLRGKKHLNFVHSYKGGIFNLVNRKTDKADFWHFIIYTLLLICFVENALCYFI